MSKLSRAAAILILSSAWTVGSAIPPPRGENPTSSAQSTQQPGNSQTADIEGCIFGDVDSFVLTDAHGKSYRLTGNTNQLAGRVGQKVRVQGHADSVTEAELIAAGGPHAAFEVQKVDTLSAACK
jgi:outer membrane protein OmpA-like peptidoglycan-associated protein